MYKDVASRFHAANHPDVRKGKYDPNNLQRGNAKDFKCSKSMQGVD